MPSSLHGCKLFNEFIILQGLRPGNNIIVRLKMYKITVARIQIMRTLTFIIKLNILYLEVFAIKAWITFSWMCQFNSSHMATLTCLHWNRCVRFANVGRICVTRIVKSSCLQTWRSYLDLVLELLLYSSLGFCCSYVSV